MGPFRWRCTGEEGKAGYILLHVSTLQFNHAEYQLRMMELTCLVFTLVLVGGFSSLFSCSWL
ncbi:hypothetical protein COCNU_11G007690 [Cocos nucifera]|uniref:Uncharacterized protein n=1 Tax=Cocos nucifera TaxID=13894 RepID=A0A8K0IPB4_COCNU|nr:hypothetical protein COCNU_11G007690 [Cocos nucifera]